MIGTGKRTVSLWRLRLQCIVIVLCFLRMLKLHKLEVENLISREGSYLVSQCIRPGIKFTLEYPFKAKYHQL